MTPATRAFLQKIFWPYNARSFGEAFTMDFRSERTARLCAWLWRLLTYSATARRVPAGYGDRTGLWFVAAWGPITPPFAQYFVGDDHDFTRPKCHWPAMFLGSVRRRRREAPLTASA
jgi:hypothetical protein